MPTLMQNSSRSASPPLPPNLEPDEEWKQTLKMNIEAALRSMVDEAKQRLNDELAKGVIGLEERERLTADHLATLETIRQLGEEQFRISLERERQERWWAACEQPDQAWSESLIEEQRTILDRIGREKKKDPATSHQLDPHHIPSFPPPPPSNLELEEEWKRTLKISIEAGLRSVADEVKEAINDELTRERERLAVDQHELLHTIRQLGEEQLQIALEREWQERWCTAGCSPDQAWSESMMEEQQAILDEIERGRKNEAFATSLQPNLPKIHPPPPPPPFQFRLVPSLSPPESSASTPSPHNHKAEHVGEPKFMLRSATPAKPTESTLRGSIQREPGMGVRSTILGNAASATSSSEASSIPSAVFVLPPSASRSVINKGALPLTTSSEDTQTSRSCTPAEHSNATSDTSYFKAPCTISVAFTEPLDALSSNVSRERSSFHSTDEEWTGSDQVQENDRERERSGYVHADHHCSVRSNNQRPDDRIEFSQPLSPSSSPAIYLQPEDSSCLHVPPPSASRSIVNERSLPSIPPQEGMQMSRSCTPAGRSSIASDTSSYFKAPYTFSVAFTEPLDALSGNVDQERSSIFSVDREWSESDQGHGEDSEREKPEDRYTNDYLVHGSDQRLDDCIGFSQLPTLSSRPATCPLPDNNSHVHVPPPSTSRPIIKKRSLPSVPPEDVQMSRRFMFARQRGASGATSSKAPCTLSVAYTDPLDALSTDVGQEHLGIHSVGQEWSGSDQGQEGDNEREKPEDGYTDDYSMHSSDQRLDDRIGVSQFLIPSPRPAAVYSQLGNDSRIHIPEAQLEEEVARWKEEMMTRELETRRKEEKVERREEEVNSREMIVRQKEVVIKRREEEVKMTEANARQKELGAMWKQEVAERKEKEAQRRMKDASLRVEATRKKEDELCKREDELHRREDELGRREEDLNCREAEMRRREDKRLQRGKEDEIRRQRAEEKKKQEVHPRRFMGMFRSTPSPQAPNSSGTRPTPDHHGRSTPATASPLTDQVSTSVAGHSNPTSDLSPAPTGWTVITSSQPSSIPEPPILATPTPQPPTNSMPNPLHKGDEIHRRQTGQAQQRKTRSRRNPTKLEHKRQENASGAMSEEDMKLLEAHRNQWNKIQTLGSLIWEDFPWPMFRRPKGPGDLISRAIRIYMLSSTHPQDRAKERIEDNIQRWRPDQFDSQLLPKVRESERERVSEGARLVVRILNDLLRELL